jgi:hypothetical protein
MGNSRATIGPLWRYSNAYQRQSFLLVEDDRRHRLVRQPHAYRHWDWLRSINVQAIPCTIACHVPMQSTSAI